MPTLVELRGERLAVMGRRLRVDDRPVRLSAIDVPVAEAAEPACV